MAALRVRNLDLLRRRASISEAVADVSGRAAGLDGLTPHARCHTAASLVIASGANVKVVQTQAGNHDLDLYGHLFGDQLDEIADATDAARTAAQDHADPFVDQT